MWEGGPREAESFFNFFYRHMLLFSRRLLQRAVTFLLLMYFFSRHLLLFNRRSLFLQQTAVYFCRQPFLFQQTAISFRRCPLFLQQTGEMYLADFHQIFNRQLLLFSTVFCHFTFLAATSGHSETQNPKPCRNRLTNSSLREKQRFHKKSVRNC